ncbi:fructose-6-phosphate aldolase [candidate division KSB1 bacterium]|nr:fructose-6-phosphate aldolase [candidate division KSB1 bacterium]
MRIFLDTGDVESIKKGVATGLVTGVTTNPSHIFKTGRKFLDVVKEICAIVPGPVSVEAMAEDAAGLIQEAKTIARIAPNIAVKIPMNVEGLKAVPVLTKEFNIKTNVTMVFSPTQAFLAMLAETTFVSIVLSRLDAIASESELLVADTVLIKQNYGFKSEVLAASLKTQNHVLAALRAGADIISLPDSLFFQMYQHPLTDAGLNQFKHDWEKVPK